MLWIALVIGMLRATRAAGRTNIKPENVIDACVYTLLAGVVFAHIASIILDLPFYIRNPREILGLWSGLLSPDGGIRGLSFHGGLIGGLGMLALYCKKKKIKFLELADLLAPTLALSYGVTRIGCFLNGCCGGVPTDLPWGVRFHMDGGITPPSHPVQLYAFGISIVIFLVLIIIEKRRRFTGQTFASYIILYAVYRFFIEFLRKGVTAEVIFAGLTEAQVVSLIMFAVTAPILWINFRKLPEKKARK